MCHFSYLLQESSTTTLHTPTASTNDDLQKVVMVGISVSNLAAIIAGCVAITVIVVIVIVVFITRRRYAKSKKDTNSDTEGKMKGNIPE